mmetsp:Transcript_8232/g.34558  ORF Transcript_8232/g.34558 Transcript_8232/m.34558 type:complete len:476 (+) Transcript_8232:36-1463(+)
MDGDDLAPTEAGNEMPEEPDATLEPHESLDEEMKQYQIFTLSHSPNVLALKYYMATVALLPKYGGHGRKALISAILFAAFGLFNLVVGSGVLSLPFAFSLVGFGLGCLILFFVCISCAATMYMVVITAENTKHWTYMDLAFAALGKHGRTFTQCVILANSVGFIVMFNILLTAFVEPMAAGVLGLNEGSFSTRAAVLVFFVWFVELPLCSMRNKNVLKYLSLVGVALVVLLMVTVLVFALDEWTTVGKPATCVVSFSLNIFYALPMFLTAYAAHLMVLPLYAEMQGKTTRRMLTAIIVAFVLISIVYVWVGVIGYMTFGEATPDNIILAYPVTNGLAMVTRLGYAFKIAITVPLGMVAVQQTAQDMYFGKPDGNPRSGEMAITFIFLGIGFVIPLFLQSVSFVMGLIGAIAGSNMAYILPATFYWRLYRPVKPAMRVVCVLVILLGLVVFFLGTATSILGFVGVSSKAEYCGGRV